MHGDFFLSPKIVTDTGPNEGVLISSVSPDKMSDTSNERSHVFMSILVAAVHNSTIYCTFRALVNYIECVWFLYSESSMQVGIETAVWEIPAASLLLTLMVRSHLFSVVVSINVHTCSLFEMRRHDKKKRVPCVRCATRAACTAHC